jgi:MYXO-CTERM domain-containing protein
MNRLRSPSFIALASAAAVAFSAGDSLACGGFFCSAAQPVNQAAERIVFSENGDGTVTAVIQILYEGPAESFSWLLPISSVPEGDDLAVASDVVFQRLQQRTNPTYTLIRRVEGECAPFDGEGGAPGSGEAGAGGARGNGGPVSVEARGVIGNFEWEVISVAPGEENPTEVAVTWLTDNGYDVPEGTPGLLRPYLEEGLYLLALRLTKGSDTGSIRPIVVTYSADRPGIPIRPTAVAANENMGVMTWVLGQARAVPQNYLSLELNEARLNWFNPSSNYDALVTAAADEAGGQGFVTEFAGNSELISDTVWSSYDEESWQNFVARQSDAYAFQDAYYTWGGWDGFWEATRATLSPPPGETSWDDVIDCPECTNLYGVSLDGTNFVAELEAATIEPVRAVQRLINAQTTVTRLYTTMSADEMTVDPLFTFNADLPDVSNFHSAERVIECAPSLYEDEAPFRIELPQGGVVRGTAQQAQNRSWPGELDSMPANLRISRLSESGNGRVLEDNGELIVETLDQYNATVPDPTGTAARGGTDGESGAPSVGGAGGVAGRGGSAGRGGATTGGSAGSAGKGGRGGQGGSGGNTEPPGGDDDDPMGPHPMTTPDDSTPELERSGCLCGVSKTSDGGRSLGAFALLALGLLFRRRA